MKEKSNLNNHLSTSVQFDSLVCAHPVPRHRMSKSLSKWVVLNFQLGYLREAMIHHYNDLCTYNDFKR